MLRKRKKQTKARQIRSTGEARGSLQGSAALRTLEAKLKGHHMNVGCKLSLVFLQYCIMANFFWLLVEGLYLHTLLVAMLPPGRCFLAYLLIGWGKRAPSPPQTPQVPNSHPV
ncbi:hypothetical protein P7K49_026165 [Saguinus oedipus]|uniref:G-protein coupled receptors family 2 profile 2 domain-containing protein n=1 Tax=Saguinus oedipus TaxID=9490 RepID=A0ABQ9UJT8_SAGOE|nr:hypothetical protein P7K49_026165 [Saguinus oedipus]